MTLLSHLREINKVRMVKRRTETHTADRNKLVCEVRRNTNIRLPRVLPLKLQLIKYSWFRNSTPKHQPDQGFFFYSSVAV